MSGFTEVEREEIDVQFVRVPDGLEHIRRAWDQLEAVVALGGRHFYGAFDPVANDYRACVEVREGDELVPGLESGTLPGGRYVRARLSGDPPGVYERIGPTFDKLVAAHAHDTSRPSLEHYRRRDEIDLLLPV
jgi:Integron-associated effector binding protein